MLLALFEVKLRSRRAEWLLCPSKVLSRDPGNLRAWPPSRKLWATSSLCPRGPASPFLHDMSLMYLEMIGSKQRASFIFSYSFELKST